MVVVGSVVVVVEVVVLVVVVVVVDVVVDVVVVVVVVVLVVVVVVVVVGTGTCLSPKRTSFSIVGNISTVCGLGVVTAQPSGTSSVTLYTPVGTQSDKNSPLLFVDAWKFTGPVTSNTNPGSGSSPSSQIPLPFGSWNLKIFR